MPSLLTSSECKKILSMLGFKHGVSPELISMRLLSDNDKDDMMAGFMSIVSLEANLVAWMANGMPDYVNLFGKTSD